MFTILFAASVGLASAPRAEPLELAVQFPRSGFFAKLGESVVNAIDLAVNEANADASAPPIHTTVYDDKSTDEGARKAASRAVASDALAMVGPGVTTAALAAGPTLAQAGLASIVPFASGDGVTANATTYRVVLSNSEMGGALAAYLRHALGGQKAVVVYRDNGYGKTVAAGFRAVADELGLSTTSLDFGKAEDLADIAQKIAADPAPVVMAMVGEDAIALLKALKANRFNGTILGTSAIASDAFAGYFHEEPQEKAQPGFFTNGVYAVSPDIFDSADADTLAFAARYRARFRAEPGWEAVQAYDAARLAIAAVRTTAAKVAGDADLRARRDAVRAYLNGIDSPERAVASLTGPLWFTPNRGRKEPTRIGRFHGDQFESAPIQFVPTATATHAEIESGAVVPVGGGAYARRQQVVYTGVYLNEIPRVDIAASTFTADFYIWLRFAKNAGADAANPAEIEFPDMTRGAFDPGKPSGKGDLDDGTIYRMWRVRGDFKNDFDLRRYPLDRQNLAIRLFNATAASDRLVYALDRRTIETGGAAAQIGALGGSSVAPAAFRNLSQWTPLSVQQGRDILVTLSALGDPRPVGVERKRELSGFRLDAIIERRTLATLAKTLLPLGIMTLILFASLWFPHGLVKEKITVAVTAALSGAVLLSSVNAQLGSVGYTIDIEYLFYLYFILCLLCIVCVLAAERLRVAGMTPAAVGAERFTQALFFAAMLGAVLVSYLVSRR